ncbi:MAG: membrane protein insertase YidC [Firmicutes bacterium]|nr:membrane protein insertase YidC [Candidatus Colivicinus equi]
MTLLDILYSIFIGPLELLYDVVYTLFYYVTSNPGLSIVALSIFINVLLLPLYNRADKIQEEEKYIENKLKPGVNHIKKHFKGDEQYMLIQTYYRQNNYKPYYSLKGLLPLLLEIPFFIAAYNYLSNLSILEGASFFIIDNLKQPDGLLNGINLLPILMTIINIISSSIYTKGDSLKAKIQLYGMALIFLVLLYNSPSGLVMYWTLNNLFSLVKNILIKLDNCNLIVSILCSIISILGIIFIVFIHPLATLMQTIGVCIGLLLLQLPIFFYLLNKKKVIKQDKEIIVDNKIFYLSCLFLCVLTGLLIPTTLIGSSPSEFIDTNTLKNPLWYILNCFCLSLGTFIIWFNVYYALLDKKIKKIICPIIFSICIIAIVDYMFFGTDLGMLSNLLKYDEIVSYSLDENVINLVVVSMTFIIMLLIVVRYKSLIKLIFSFMLISMLFISSFNIYKSINIISVSLSNLKYSLSNYPKITLSKNKKNVIVFMLDAAVSNFIPYILCEKPELLYSFSGFTYYPNTVTFGGSTNAGTPGLFGGYEYTPLEMKKRSNESLASKHNEALKVMPAIFSNNGYNVSVFNPPYAGYKEVPDLSIYDECEGVHAYLTTNGVFKNEHYDTGENLDVILNRNLFCYSIFKISPVIIQPIIYNGGKYNSVEESTHLSIQEIDGISKARGYSSNFIKNYLVLDNLLEITDVTNTNCGSFIMIDNELPHTAALLEEPSYTPSDKIDNTDYDYKHKIRKSLFGESMELDNEYQMRFYHSNMSAIIKLSEWFDYLRDNDVFDNTRIIIVSDHGRALNKEEFKNNDTMEMQALLLVKDFDSNNFLIDDTFMTNADTPYLATYKIIKNPTNPYTNKMINCDYKENTENLFLLKTNVHISENCGNSFIENEWLSIHDNIFDVNNWKHNVEIK